MEFGWYTKDMLKAILLFTQVSYLEDPNRVHKPGTDSSGILWLDGNRWLSVQNIMADEKCPRLLQISATHPYFNKTIFKMDVLSKSIDAKLGGDFRSGSWFALNQLMCRSTPTKQYHSGDFSDASRTSLSRLTQITRNAASSLEALVMPPQQKSTSSKEDLEREGCRAALNFLFDRLLGLGAALPTNEKPPPNIWGVKMILTKIYELLLGIVLIYQGYRSKSQEIHPDCLEVTFVYLKKSSTKGFNRQYEGNPSFFVDHAKKNGGMETSQAAVHRCSSYLCTVLAFKGGSVVSKTGRNTTTPISIQFSHLRTT
ncbi:hypothetical protein PGT21_000562 [Puccinia graminis f. sp. tritici]|uniref:Uncharacterized protein n=1 Tax=Puccinia graminis f. sp. tritici TaxID=56615 RepID=A0A5B0P4V8_PUCGR|nr:hypothetical protein PGT21_000562 [Puccinia graminis f. sp. tritici]